MNRPREPSYAQGLLVAQRVRRDTDATLGSLGGACLVTTHPAAARAHLRYRPEDERWKTGGHESRDVKIKLWLLAEEKKEFFYVSNRSPSNVATARGGMPTTNQYNKHRESPERSVTKSHNFVQRRNPVAGDDAQDA